MTGREEVKGGGEEVGQTDAGPAAAASASVWSHALVPSPKKWPGRRAAAASLLFVSCTSRRDDHHQRAAAGARAHTPNRCPPEGQTPPKSPNIPPPLP